MLTLSMLGNVVYSPLAQIQLEASLFIWMKSQEKLALLINMDRSYYASIETGLRNVTLVNMAKIADGLGVDLSELLRGVRD